MLWLVKIIWVVLLGVLLWTGFRIFKQINQAAGVFTGSKGLEACPSCKQWISVPKQQNSTCPKCGVRLGRTQEGKLLIRIND